MKTGLLTRAREPEQGEPVGLLIAWQRRLSCGPAYSIAIVSDNSSLLRPFIRHNFSGSSSVKVLGNGGGATQRMTASWLHAHEETCFTPRKRNASCNFNWISIWASLLTLTLVCTIVCAPLCGWINKALCTSGPASGQYLKVIRCSTKFVWKISE